MDKLTELVLLLEKRIELNDAIYQERLIRQVSEVGVNLSKHKRDQHNGSFDVEYYLRCERERDAEIDKLYKKLEENKSRFSELKKELQI